MAGDGKNVADAPANASSALTRVNPLANLGNKSSVNDKLKATNPLAMLGENLGITLCLDRAGKGFKSVGDLGAKSADRALIANAKVILGSIGSKLNGMAHDDAMPVKMHSGIERGASDSNPRPSALPLG